MKSALFVSIVVLFACASGSHAAVLTADQFFGEVSRYTLADVDAIGASFPSVQAVAEISPSRIDDELGDLANTITTYVMNHPEAQDTLDGVANDWLGSNTGSNGELLGVVWPYLAYFALNNSSTSSTTIVIPSTSAFADVGTINAFLNAHGWNYAFVVEGSGGSTASVPEPSTLLLLASGLVCLVRFGRRSA